MPATYEPIATTTLSSAAKNIIFSSIPATYTDLRLVILARADIAGTGTYSNPGIRFNDDSGTNYSQTYLNGNGSTASSSRDTSLNYHYYQGIARADSPNSFFSIDIFNYAGSTFKTSLAELSRDLNGSGNVQRHVYLWRSTSAINKIDIQYGVFSGTSQNFATGTTATLYGIKAF